MKRLKGRGRFSSRTGRGTEGRGVRGDGMEVATIKSILVFEKVSLFCVSLGGREREGRSPRVEEREVKVKRNCLAGIVKK